MALFFKKRAGTPLLQRIEHRPDRQGWFQDPLDRFNYRWFNGDRWTRYVGHITADGKHTQLEDPV